MSSMARTASESSDTPQARRKFTKRITSPVDDDESVTGPPLKRARLDGSDGESLGSPEVSRPPARSAASGSRSKAKQPPKKKRSKVVMSDPESEDFDPVDDESEAEMPVEDEDDEEYMSEPKSTGKRKGKVAKGGKGKKKPEPKEIVARDERKRPVQDPIESAGTPAAKRPRTKAAQKSGAEVVVDGVEEASAAGTSPPREDAAPAPARKKLPQIKKNKPQTGASAATVPAASGTGTSTPSVPAKPVPLAAEESKLPPPVVGAGTRKTTLPISADVDLSNPMMYAQLFKSGGGSTPSGFSRREKDEERRKELNRMRDEARAKRISEAPPPFDLQGQMDKIARFEEKLRNSRSPAVYPNFIAGGLKSLQAGKKCYAGTDLEAREEGEM